MCDYCCEEEDKDNAHQRCELCHVTSGTSEILKAVKPEFLQSSLTKVINLATDAAYVHLFCAFWFVEIEAHDMLNFDSIIGIEELLKTNALHEGKECGLCKATSGAKLKCSDRNC